MNIGLFLPTWSGGMAGETPSAREVVAFACAAEQAGFGSLWVSDHFYNEPYLDFEAMHVKLPAAYAGVKSGAWECWSLMAALAMVTKHATLGTLITNTGFRNPALLARMIDTVDDLSNGRIVAGLGAGDFATEHRAFGFPFERRISRFEEALKIICPLLRSEQVTLAGEFQHAHEARLLPKGPRVQGPEILIGSLLGGPRMLRLVAQYADIWHGMLAFGDSRTQVNKDAWQGVVRACDKHGRDAGSLARHVTVGVAVQAGSYAFPGARPLDASSSELADELAAYDEQGVATVSMVVEPCNEASLASLAPLLAQHSPAMR
jgi:alkanesulfonate monooxygenase SsuD/methylene tetrahydromethanopterin reductase-like flavin-dependent oxidoreductase (luciferase family)